MSKRVSITALKKELAIMRKLSNQPTDTISWRFTKTLNKLDLLPKQSVGLSLDLKYKYARRYKELCAKVRKMRR